MSTLSELPVPKPQPFRIPLSDEQLIFCGQSCRTLFTEIGIGSSITYLFSTLRTYIPLTRVFCGFRRYRLSTFSPVADTLPNAHNRVRTLATSTLTQDQINFMVGTDEMTPYTINNAYDLTDQQTSLRSEDLASYLRIPMFTVGEAVFQLIFCSNIPGTFSNSISEQLLLATKPLGEALRERFMLTGQVQLAESIYAEGSACDKLQLCEGLTEMRQQIEQVAVTDCSVLILGETGTGKEVAAEAIRELSSRSEQPFIKVNCGAINEHLVDSELFGHEKGAFTGAQVSRVGAFEAANGGTIFLDEVGDLPLPLQARLLRVLDSREIQRVGATRTIPLDIRVIAATHRNLAEMVKQGKFREDLWYRLNVFVLRVPPLRSRRIDIPTLAQFFLNTKARILNILPAPSLMPVQAEKLCLHNWPGNIRELEHLIERVLVRSKVGASSIELPFDEEMQQVQAMDGVYNIPLVPDAERKNYSDGVCNNVLGNNALGHPNSFSGNTRQQTGAAAFGVGVEQPSATNTFAPQVADFDMPHSLLSLARAKSWPSLKDVTESYINDAMRRCGGKIGGDGGAAKLLGVHPNTLRNRKYKSEE